MIVRVVALVPAHDEADRVGATVRSLGGISDVGEVIVVDDGSSDGTSSVALKAGATVLTVPRRVGKGAALEGALRRLPSAEVWLLADADLEETAAGLRAVLQPVLDGSADLAIAIPPPQAGGGLGTVKLASSRLIALRSGFRPQAPLSGQRAITAHALAACRPLAGGFGVEVAMTIDAVRRGFRVIEVPAEVRHRPTGRGVRGFVHRGKQGIDITRAVLPRRVRRR